MTNCEYMPSDSKTLLQHTYEQLLSFYDMADDLIDTVEHEQIESPIAQLEFIEPLVERVEIATDILTEEYRHFATSGEIPTTERKERIENALGHIFDIINTLDDTPSLEE